MLGPQNIRRIKAMNAPLKAVAGATKLDVTMRNLGHEARAAAHILALAPTAQKNRALGAMAKAIRGSRAAILAANDQDVAQARSGGAGAAFLDRLTLKPSTVEAMATGLETIRKIKDPIGAIIASWRRPNGMRIERVRVPLGVVGVIYESRPNVTADAGALCLKSGNAVVLRGGSDSFHSSTAIHACLVEGLAAAGLPEAVIAMPASASREAVAEMLAGLDGALDVIVPRGGKSLVARVQNEARVPVFAHLEGVVHVYVDSAADLEVAKKVLINSKLRRTGICGAAEKLLVDKTCAATHLKPLVQALLEAGCAVRGDAAALAADPRVTKASEEDWRAEYLDAIITAKVIDGLDAAIDHIETYGSH